MWIERLTDTPTLHAIELAARFAEQRHRVLAENVANIDTPDYHSKRLDQAAFANALHEALERAAASGARRLELRGAAQVSTAADGELEVQPVVEPAANVLFHDGRNASLERVLADVQENALRFNVAVKLLEQRFGGLLTAIRGRMT